MISMLRLSPRGYAPYFDLKYQLEKIRDEMTKHREPATLAPKMTFGGPRMSEPLLNRVFQSRSIRRACRCALLSWFAACQAPSDDPDRQAAEAISELGGSVKWGRDEQNKAVITEVGLATLPVTDRDLKRLAGLKHLKKLTLGLGGSKITNQGLAELSDLRELEHLDLSNTAISDDGLQHLKNLTGLRFLALNNSKVTGTGLQHLKALGDLAELELTDCATDEGLKTISGAKNLQRLLLDSSKVTDDGIKQIKTCSNMRLLTLGSTQVTDAGLKHVAALSKLRTLDLYDTRVGDQGIKELVGLKELRLLMVLRTNVSAAGAASFQKSLPHCRVLLGDKK
jgi:Leucine Rich repeat